MTNYHVVARNFSTSSENRMHSDEMAARYGFSGALVPGVAIYGHLVKPLVDHYGEAWLQNSCAEVKLIKPTYHGDQLTLTWLGEDQDVSAANQHGELVALLSSEPLAALTENLGLDGEIKTSSRPEIAWDNVLVNEVFSPRLITLDAQENERYCSEIADEDALYRQFVHPHYLLSLANDALMQEYQMPAWIHVKSKISHRLALSVGQEVLLRCVVTDRWERKGHQFIAIHLSFWLGDDVAVDIKHQAIFRIAE